MRLNDRYLFKFDQLDLKSCVNNAPNPENYITTSDSSLKNEISNDKFRTRISLNRYTGNDKEVVIDSNVDDISENAFVYSRNLEKVIILPNKTGRSRIIERGAFADQKHLKEVILSDDTICISNSAFERCAGLIDLTLPTKLKYIGDNAFAECINLKKINIPKSTRIGYGVFRGSGITSIDIDIDSRYEYNDDVGLLIEKYDNTKKYDKLLWLNHNIHSKVVVIPPNVAEIGIGAFQLNKEIEIVHLPLSVGKIMGSAFLGCTNLIECRIPGDVVYISEDAFASCRSLTLVCKENSYVHRYAIFHQINYKLM